MAVLKNAATVCALPLPFGWIHLKGMHVTADLVLTGPTITLPLASTSPYVTLVILECTATDISAEVARLGRHLEGLVKSRKGLVREVLATTTSGDSDPGDASQPSTDGTAEEGAI